MRTVPADRIFDAHAHFVSSDFLRFPLSEVAPPGSLQAKGGAEIRRRARQSLRDRLARSSFDVANILKQWDLNGVVAGAGVQYRSAYGTDNSYLMSIARKRIAPVVGIVTTQARTISPTTFQFAPRPDPIPAPTTDDAAA